MQITRVIGIGMCLWAGLCPAQTAKHPFSIDDWTFQSIADAEAVSPKGVILYRVYRGAESGPEQSDWHVINSDGSSNRKIEPPKEFHPMGFDADGDLYGRFTVNGSSEIGIFSLDGLGPSSLPKRVIFLPLPRGFDSVSLSPDGTRLALLANPQAPEPESKYKTVIEPSQTGLFVIDMDGSKGKWWVRDLHDIQQVAWNLDSKSMALLSTLPKIGYHYVESQIDIATETGYRHIATIKGVAGGLAWTNMGREIAFLGTNTSVLTPDHVWTVGVQGGTPTDRTPTLDGSAMSLVGDCFGRVWVQVNRGVHPECDLFENGVLKTVRTDSSLPVLPQTNVAHPPLVFMTGDPDHVPSIAVEERSGLRKLTSVGEEFLAKVDLPHKEAIHWTSREGIHLEGIATFPAGFQKGHRYPFLVMPHGGPESNDMLDADTFPRIIAGIGYVVIQPNYRGSTGYGSAFMDAIYQHFGDRAYRDVDSATDFAIEQGWADPKRLAIMGWSAGGFMTAWTITQTHRYRAAIEGAGITDWGSFIWTSDVQQIDYDARWPGKEPQYFHQFSAVDFADRVTTPLLILHGGADVRVPTYQGQEFFEALRANGKTVRMVTYPGSGHFPDLLEQQRDIFKEAIAWLAKYNN